MTTSSLATILRRLADLSDARGLADEATAWRELERIAADRNVQDEIALGRNLGERPSATVCACADHLAREGAEATLEASRSALPWMLRRLLELGHLDTAEVVQLADRGVLTIGELAEALKHPLPRPPGGLERSLAKAIETLRLERLPVPLGRAIDLLDGLIEVIGGAAPTLVPFTMAGDARRSEPLVDWLAVVAAAHAPRDVLDRIGAMRDVHPVRHWGAGRIIATFGGVEVDIRVAVPQAFGTVLLEATGSPAHVTALCAGGSALQPAPREEEAYARLGLPWIAPELRHDTGEVEAARAGRLPPLIEREHIRGDLHMHTDYSDGRDPVVAMVRAASALGYSYIAITDHSTRSFASRTLTLDSLARQREEIAEARARFPSLAILHGVEVDIMPDGQLDFPDHVLEPFDIVLASLHDRAGHDEAELTRRCLAAIRHPLVNVITHPANRMVGRDSGYDLDFDAIFDAAAATGTALEVDGAPGHLDLDGELARRAIVAGATLVVDSDCHRASLLDRQMRFGIGTARRGWVEPRNVLNTRPVEDVRRFVARKRQG